MPRAAKNKNVIKEDAKSQDDKEEEGVEEDWLEASALENEKNAAQLDKKYGQMKMKKFMNYKYDVQNPEERQNLIEKNNKKNVKNIKKKI